MDESNQELNCGYAQTDITPENWELCQLIGFNRPHNHAKGVLHRLMAQVLVMENSELTSCIVTIDSIGFTIELTNLLRENVAKKLKTVPDHVMVCFSHTHAAPDAALNNYFYYAMNKILQAVETAASNLVSVFVAWGIGNNTVAVNRRAGCNTIDNRIGILKIADAKTKKAKVMLLRVTAHPNILTSDNYFISSDYFGVTRTKLEQEYQCNVMITQGAAGNVRAKYRQRNADFLEENPLEVAKTILSEADKKETFAESLQALEKTAEEILLAAGAIWHNLKPAPVYKYNMFCEKQTFAADVPTRQQAAEIAMEAQTNAGINGNAWLEEVEKLIALNIKQQFSEKEIQFLLLMKAVCVV